MNLAEPTVQAGVGTGVGTEQLAERLSQVQERIERACAAAGRDPAEVGLLAVSKLRTAEEVRQLYHLGQRDFGESKYQELSVKTAELADLPGLRWHFIGQLQRNKAAKVARLVDAVLSADRLSLVQALARCERDTAEPLDVFLQLSIDGDETRGGACEGDLMTCADAVANEPRLRLRGLMTSAPMDWTARDAFTRAAEVSAALSRRHPGAGELSAGMSNDLEEAVACGATLVRIGTSLFGQRDYGTPPAR
jgi:pyridoxal phosphate enzyme (YggS family)